MKVVNLSNNRELGADVRMAASMPARIKGLLGCGALSPGTGLWIKPCMGIHTFGMRFPIDVIFLDKEYHVIAIKKSLLPNRMTPLHFNAGSVLELPVGTVEATSTEIGNEIKIIQ